MKTNYLCTYCLLLLAVLLYSPYEGTAQVGINTSTPASGAILDINSSDKGFLMPRVALTGTDDVSTIKPTATVGLLVYNTATAGTLPYQVTPGFYYWTGGTWRRLFAQGYSLEYEQTSEVRAHASNTTYVLLPGLDSGTITVPFSGTYQIRVTASHAAGDLQSPTTDGATQGSVSLWIDTDGVTSTTPVKATYITSSSKRISGTTVNNLARSATIIYNVELDATKTYRFYVQGREWLARNVQRGWFGKDTNGYSGSSSVNDAQRGTMTVMLIKQN